MTEKILATFRIEPEQWEAFKNKAKANGTNASAVLLHCVAQYLDDNVDNDSEQNLDTEPLTNVDSRLDEKVKDYLDNSLVSHLDKYLDSRLDEKVRDYLDKQGNELNSLKQQVEALQSEMKKGLEREQEKQPIEDKTVATVHLNQHPDGEGNTGGKAPDNPI